VAKDQAWYAIEKLKWEAKRDEQSFASVGLRMMPDRLKEAPYQAAHPETLLGVANEMMSAECVGSTPSFPTAFAQFLRGRTLPGVFNNAKGFWLAFLNHQRRCHQTGAYLGLFRIENLPHLAAFTRMVKSLHAFAMELAQLLGQRGDVRQPLGHGAVRRCLTKTDAGKNLVLGLKAGFLLAKSSFLAEAGQQQEMEDQLQPLPGDERDRPRAWEKLQENGLHVEGDGFAEGLIATDEEKQRARGAATA
jgi:hypothetical protein